MRTEVSDNTTDIKQLLKEIHKTALTELEPEDPFCQACVSDL